MFSSYVTFEKNHTVRLIEAYRASIRAYKAHNLIVKGLMTNNARRAVLDRASGLVFHSPSLDPDMKNQNFYIIVCDAFNESVTTAKEIYG